MSDGYFFRTKEVQFTQDNVITKFYNSIFLKLEKELNDKNNNSMIFKKVLRWRPGACVKVDDPYL